MPSAGPTSLRDSEYESRQDVRGTREEVSQPVTTIPQQSPANKSPGQRSAEQERLQTVLDRTRERTQTRHMKQNRGRATKLISPSVPVSKNINFVQSQKRAAEGLYGQCC